MRHWASTFTCLAALAATAGCGRVTEEPPAAQASERARDFVRLDPQNPRLDFIKIDVVKESDGAARITLPGRISFDEDRTQRVASPIDGRATAILVKLGDKVKAGQPLIQLSSPHVGQLQSDAQKAMSDLGVSEKALDRVHKLQGDGAVSEKEAAQAEADFKKARSDYARATVQLKALGVSASDPAVNVALRAQIPGVVVERNVLVGQEVRGDAAAPLLTVSSLDSVWVLADAYEQDLGMVQEGANVSIRVPAYPGETFSGKVKHIGEVVDPNTRTVKIRCVVDNPGHRLKPEMFAKVDVQNVKGTKFIAIPSKSVLNDGDKSMVIVASEGNVFRVRKVEVGPESDDGVRILSGLAPGEKIVTAGAIFMKQEIDSH
jgi:cobalt-zinc-cadmium efflux system membrane fusion protein